MPNFAPDRGDEARLALQDVARDYGPSGLDNPKVFEQVLPDLLAGAPLASNLLTAAASAGVGRMLTDRFAASIPTEAAVRDVAALLSQRSALDMAAAQWVVAEYARVLGRPVDDAAMAAMSPPAPMQPVHQMPPQAPPPMQQMTPPAQVPAQPPFGQPPYGQPAFGQPVSGQPVSGQPVSGQPISGQPGFGQPVSGQPVSGQPGFGQPVSGQPMGAPAAAGMAAGGIPPGGGMSAAGEPNATQLDNPGQPRIAGRAAAPVQPNQGRVLDDTAPFPVGGQPSFSPPYPPQPGFPQQPPYGQAPGYQPQQPGYPPQQPGFPPGGGYGGYAPVSPVRRSKAPWVIGGIVALLVIGAVVAIVLVSGSKKCTGSSCQAGPTHTPTVPVTKPPTTPPVTTPPPGPTQVELAQVMPKDVNVATCTPDTNNATLMSNVTTSLSCNEGASSLLPGAAVLGYQFSDPTDYSNGLGQLNSHTGINPATASDTCPPASGKDTGVNTWHRGDDASAPALGKLECFTDTDNYNYFIWTDDSELTVEIIKADHGQSFDDIAKWWSTNNNNSTG